MLEVFRAPVNDTLRAHGIDARRHDGSASVPDNAPRKQSATCSETPEDTR